VKKKRKSIVTINASPLKKGTVDKLLTIFEKEAGKQVTIIRVNLYDYAFFPHDGNLMRKPLWYPFIKDMEEADSIVIATPTYWFNIPGQLKNFIDMLTEHIDWDNNSVLLEGKKLGIIAVSPGGGATNILENLALTLNTMGMIIPSYALMFFGSQDQPDNPNGWQKKNIKELAQRLRRFEP